MHPREIRVRARLLLSGAILVAGVSSVGVAWAASPLTDLAATGSLSGWTTFGTVATTNSTVNLTLGGNPFTLTPASGHYMAYIDPAGSGIVLSNIDATLGLSAGTINAILSTNSVGSATNFGVLTQTQTLAAGAYSFTWSYAATDYQPYNDGVLFSLSGAGVNSVSVLADNGPLGPQAETNVVGSYGATQWVTKSFTIATAGSYQIGFVSYNWDDYILDPVLFVSDALGTVTGGAVPIDTNAAFYLSSGLGTTVLPDFQGGVLQIDSGGTIADNFDVEDFAGNAIDPHGFTATMSGTFTGDGGLNIDDTTGGGVVIFTNAGGNTYSGVTTVTTGTLQAGANGAFSPNSAVVMANASGAVLDLAGFNETIDGFSGGGAAGGNVLLGASRLTTNNGGTYGGIISGTGGLTLTSGTLVLNGVNTFSGSTIVSGGILAVGDGTHTGAVLDSHVGGVSVGNGAILEGHGTIVGAVTNNSGGTVAPGGSIGTLTVGSYTQGATGTFQVEVSPSAASLLHVTGAATLNGALSVDFDSGTYGRAHVYKILDASTVSGRFATATYSDAPYEMVYGTYYNPAATEVDLVIESKRAGQMYGDVATAALDAAQSLNSMIFTHMGDQNCRGRTTTSTERGDADKKICPQLSVWSRGYGGVGTTDESNHANAFNTRWAGFIGGVDYRLENGSTLGVAFSYGQNSLIVSDAWGKTVTDSYSVFVSGSIPVARGQLDADVFYTSNAATGRRDTGYLGILATSHPSGHVVGGAVQYSYPLFDGDLTPLARLSYAEAKRVATTETGGGPLDLAIGADTYSSLRADIGVRLSHRYTTDDGVVLVPELRGGMQAEMASISRDTSARLADVAGTNFTAPYAPFDRAAVTAGFGLTMVLGDGISLYLDGDGRASNAQKEGVISLGARIRF